MKTKQILTKLSFLLITIIGLYTIYSFTRSGNESTTNYDASYYQNADATTSEIPIFNVFDEGKCGDGKAAKKMKEGESKCGEGKASDHAKSDESKCGDGKTSEEGKCGGDKKEATQKTEESKCGGDKKEMDKKEEKCGTGKCG